MDLDIEDKKDVTATILKLYCKGFIEFSNNEIIVIKNDEDKQLRHSERMLLGLIENKLLNKENIENWKNICINECLIDGYIKSVDFDKKKKIELL